MRLPDEVLLDILHHLNRESLDAIGITSRQFHAVSWKNMSALCLRRIRNVYLTHEGVTVVMSTMDGEQNESGYREVDREERNFPGQFNVGLCLRSSSCRFISLEFDRSKGERHFDEVMQGLLENASTIAAREIFFKWAILRPSGFALTTRLVESLIGVRHVDYGTCFRVTFPDVSFEQAVKDLEARQETAYRVMDDEIVGFCKKKTPGDRHRSVAFSSVTVTKDLFRKIVQMRINDELPEEFALRIICPYNNPQQDLGDFETVLENPGGWGGPFAVKGTDFKLRHDSDDERDYRDAEIWNYSYSEEKYATNSE